MRLQQKSFRTYLQWELNSSNCHWQDLVATSVRQTAHHFRLEVNALSREDDFHVFSADQPLRFNWMQFFQKRAGAWESQITDHLVALFQRFMEMRNNSTVQSGGDPMPGSGRLLYRQ